VNHRVQSLDTAIHYFGEACLFGNFDDLKPGISQLFAGTARGKNFYAEFGKAGYKRNQSTLVRNTDQRASYVEHAITWKGKRGKRQCCYRISE